MKLIRILQIKQVKTVNRPDSVACSGGWAKRPQSSHTFSLNIEWVIDHQNDTSILESGKEPAMQRHGLRDEWVRKDTSPDDLETVSRQTSKQV